MLSVLLAIRPTVGLISNVVSRGRMSGCSLIVKRRNYPCFCSWLGRLINMDTASHHLYAIISLTVKCGVSLIGIEIRLKELPVRDIHLVRPILGVCLVPAWRAGGKVNLPRSLV